MILLFVPHTHLGGHCIVVHRSWLCTRRCRCRYGRRHQVVLVVGQRGDGLLPRRLNRQRRGLVLGLLRLRAKAESLHRCWPLVVASVGIVVAKQVVVVVGGGGSARVASSGGRWRSSSSRLGAADDESCLRGLWVPGQKNKRRRRNCSASPLRSRHAPKPPRSELTGGGAGSSSS